MLTLDFKLTVRVLSMMVSLQGCCKHYACY